MRWMGLLVAFALAGCSNSTQEAWDMADAAQEEATSAKARVEELEIEMQELEARVSNLEFNQSL